jgi:hypothetical protein
VPIDAVCAMKTNSTVSYQQNPATLNPVADLAPTSCGQGWGKGANVSGSGMIEEGLSVEEKEDISALTFMANLASTHSSDGRGQEAEELGRRTS